jgi:hypothetical protein
MARIYRTISLSLHPDHADELERRGKRLNVSGARVAANMVIRELANTEPDSRRGRLSPFVERTRDVMTELVALSRELSVPIDHLIALYPREGLPRMRVVMTELIQLSRSLDVDVGHLVTVYAHERD